MTNLKEYSINGNKTQNDTDRNTKDKVVTFPKHHCYITGEGIGLVYDMSKKWYCNMHISQK